MTAKDYLKKEGIPWDSEIIAWMEDYAEIKAVEFAEWCYKKQYRYDIRGWWFQDHSVEKYTTAELYTKFLSDAGGKEGE